MWHRTKQSKNKCCSSVYSDCGKKAEVGGQDWSVTNLEGK